MDFLKQRGAELHLRTLLAIIKKFEHDGFLLKVGQKGNDPVYGSTYVAQTLDVRALEYGDYDFYYHGFSAVRRHFIKSVLPLDVSKADGSPDIGTCFVIAANRLLTARHCVENKRLIKIMDPMKQIITPSNIWIPTNNMDIALIEMKNYNFDSLPKLNIEYGDVLEEVLTMGYPPIPGFDAINISDITHVGATLKVSEGKIIAEDRTLFDANPYFLINAKVKGGNSGGPIINRRGHAIGMITDIPLNAENREQFDHLGYGVAITGTQLNNFLANVQRKENVTSLPLIITKDGFSTLN